MTHTLNGKTCVFDHQYNYDSKENLFPNRNKCTVKYNAVKFQQDQDSPQSFSHGSCTYKDKKMNESLDRIVTYPDPEDATKIPQDTVLFRQKSGTLGGNAHVYDFCRVNLGDNKNTFTCIASKNKQWSMVNGTATCS